MRRAALEPAGSLQGDRRQAGDAFIGEVAGAARIKPPFGEFGRYRPDGGRDISPCAARGGNDISPGLIPPRLQERAARGADVGLMAPIR